MKKTLSSIAIAFTLIFSTGVVSSSPVLAAPATTATQSLTKFYQSLPSDPGKFKPEQIQEVKNRLNIGSMEILILFVSGIIAAGLLKMADSLASTFGGDSGIGQISSNVSQSMQMLGGTAVSKTWGATKTVAGWGVAGAWAGLKGLGKKGNRYDSGGGDESKARTPNEFNGEGEKPDSEKNENPTSPQQENPPPTNDKDNPPPPSDDHRDNADKNAYDNEEKKEETTEKTETTETAETTEKTPAEEETAIPVAPKKETESTGTPNPTPDNPTPDNPTPAPVTTPATPPASKPVELPKHEG